MARYVLVGTRPSELVDVKVDLTFHYNTLTRNGSYFNRQVSLKLVSRLLPRGRLSMACNSLCFAVSLEAINVGLHKLCLVLVGGRRLDCGTGEMQQKRPDRTPRAPTG